VLEKYEMKNKVGRGEGGRELLKMLDVLEGRGL
jgi:hypothetical protein